MSVADHKAIVSRFYEASNSGELDTLMSLLHDDIRWTNIGSTPFSRTCEGKQDLVENLLGPVFSRLDGGIHATVHRMIGEDDIVVVQLDGTARTIEGRDYNNTYCHVFRIADGQIIEATEYFDTALAVEVLTQPRTT